MSYKRLTPCILIDEGKAVKWFDDRTVISDDVVSLAKHYGEHGADELIIFDLSNSDESREITIELMGKINRVIGIPMVAGGHIKHTEDVKQILDAGAKRAMLNLSKPSAIHLLEESANCFGKEKIAVSLNDFDSLFKRQHTIGANCSEMIFMHRLDLNSVVNITEIPCVVVTDTMEQEEILKILKSSGVKGVSGLFISRQDMDFDAFKEVCAKEGIRMTSFESVMDFSEFKLNSDGLIPVIVQDYRTSEVLMMAYMDEEAFEHTVKTGRMTYYSRSRKQQWIIGETSGHYQYVKSIAADCDKDTLLAKVEQIGAACHTGNRSCFFQQIVGSDYDIKNPLLVFESVYNAILDKKQTPKEGSYANYLFERGLDKILKKIGEEGSEIIIAAKNPNSDDVKSEISDFLYHLMVLMVERGITWEDITEELADR